MSSPKEIIEKIRRVGFGIGMDTSNLSTEQTEYINDKRKVLDDVAKLVSEINTQKPRFIFELIQNAEDNEYKAGKIPKIQFVVSREKIIVQNNEIGFVEENVKALCGMGGSTKEDKTRGYIGEKGIGFKSVFMVSDNPIIVSNGFQFSFNYTKKHPRTMLIPVWIDKTPSEANLDETNIFIPIRPDFGDNINSFVDQINPSLLLFLTKIKVIGIKNRLNGRNLLISRFDKNGTVEIKQGTRRFYWKTLTTTIPINVQEDRRENFKKTDIMLAFPMKSGKPLTTQDQFVFAFLPIRKFGFNFIIHADFILNVAREDIITHLEWNKHIRDNLTAVFIQAIDQLKTYEAFKYSFYGFIPRKEKVDDDFFSVAVDSIYENLSRHDFLLTESGNWCKPTETLIANSKLQHLFSNKTVKAFFNKEYLSRKAGIPPELLKEFKVAEFDFDLIADCLNRTEWLKKQDDGWFVDLYAFLSQLSSKQIETLSKLNIFKLENNELASCGEQPVFFPLDSKKQYGFEVEIRIIKNAILKEAKEKGKKCATRVRSFLRKSGVKERQPYQVIQEHILPISEDDRWKNKSNETLLAYIRYIKDNLHRYERENSKRLAKEKTHTAQNPLERLRKNIWLRIVSEEGNVYTHPEKIYLSTSYDNTADCEHLFCGIDDAYFLHPSYIESDNEIKKAHKSNVQTFNRKSSLGQIKAWKDFFLKIGVQPSLIVEKDHSTKLQDSIYYVSSTLTQKKIYSWNKDGTPWKEVPWEDSDYGYYINDDWKSDHFISFCANLAKITAAEKPKQAKKMLKMLDNNWNSYKQFTSCKYYYRRYHQPSWYSDETDSSFLLALKNTHWCPTKSGVLEQPKKVFADKTEIKNILGNTVAYLGAEIKNREFIKVLGVHLSVSIDDVLQFLAKNITQTTFSIEKAEKVYRIINDSFKGSEIKIKEAFQNQSLIFIPDNCAVNANKVFWQDLKEVFGDTHFYLENYYPTLREFFVSKVGIQPSASFKDYADLLLVLCKKSELGIKEKELVFKIYEELNFGLTPRIGQQTIGSEDWWLSFRSSTVLLNNDGNFSSNSQGKVLLCDNQRLFRMFQKAPQLSFLALPKDYNPDKILFFLKAFNIRFLSSVVTSSPLIDESLTNENRRLTKRFQKVLPFILRFLYWKSYETYAALRASSVLVLKRLVVCVADQVTVKFSIKLDGLPTIDRIGEDQSILDDNKLVISKKIEQDQDSFAIEISRIFSSNRELDSFIMFLMNKPSNEKREEMMKKLEIENLPESEIRFLESNKRAQNRIHVKHGKDSAEGQQKGKVSEGIERKPADNGDLETANRSQDLQPPTSELPPLEESTAGSSPKEEENTRSKALFETEQEVEGSTVEGEDEVEETPSSLKLGEAEPGKTELREIEYIEDHPRAIDEISEDSKENNSEDSSEDQPKISYEPEPTEEAPSEKEPSSESPPQSEKPRKPRTTTIVSERRDTTNTDLVKNNWYRYNCQICLCQQDPDTLFPSNSYAKPEINRKMMIQAHHILEVERDEGHDDPGNILSLCMRHHRYLHTYPFGANFLNVLKRSINNATDKEISWPSGGKFNWTMLTCTGENGNGPTLKIVFNKPHLKSLKTYLDFIYNRPTKVQPKPEDHDS